jgi:hypothetical protein
MKKVIIFDKVNNKKYIFKNIIECLKTFNNFKKDSLQVYLSISKETKKYKFNYEK